MTGGAKTTAGNFFEDFQLGQTFRHATPRTVTAGDVALYQALYGGRFAVQSSAPFARRIGYREAPVDDLLTFHIVFGKTVADISLNAVANLGYADVRFGAPVYPGDTLSTTTTIIGLKENSNGKTGTVYVRSTGSNQDGATILDFIRWVMVRKADSAAPAPAPHVPDLPAQVAAENLHIADGLDMSAGYDMEAAGSAHLWDDYEAGERIDHVDGVTVEDAEHMMATRLYQNTARVHFDGHAAKSSRFERRLIYGGHVISLVRALSFNGLANGFALAAINGGRHTAPCFAGDTVYAWSEVLDRLILPERSDLGALRLRSIATKDLPCDGFPASDGDGNYDPAVILDLDYTVLMPRR